MFYLHFQNGEAVRQIEIAANTKTFLSLNNPIQGDSMLYDKTLESLDIDEKDFISKDEFDKVWYSNKTRDFSKVAITILLKPLIATLLNY